MISSVDVERFPYRGLVSEFPVEKMPQDTVCKQPSDRVARTLRVGILLDSMAVPAWVYEVLASLKKTDGVCLALVVLSEPKREKPKGLKDWAFEAYCRLDRLVFARKVPSEAFRRVDARSLLGNIATMSAAEGASSSAATSNNAGGGGSDGSDASMDLLLDFGLGSSGDLYFLRSTYGVMSFVPGDDDVYRGGPALFWEMYEKDAVSATTLRLFDGTSPGGERLYRSYSRTHPCSLFMNRTEVYWKTAAVFIEQVKKLRDGRLRPVKTVDSAGAEVPARHMPTLWELFKFVVSTGSRLVAQQFRTRLFHERWSMAFTELQRGEQRLPGKEDHFKTIEPPRGRFYADPFAVSHDGKEFIFFEDYVFRAMRGRIGCLELDPETGKILNNRTILEEDFHMSYPCVVEVDGTWFMIPETSEDRTIRLYRAVEFPWKWTLDTVLMKEVNAVDNTLHWEDGRFWMFVNLSPPGSSSHDELHLFHAESIRGPWLPHPQNPVMTDTRKARAAGGLFRIGDSLYRPSQNCSIVYGRSMVLNKVETLTVHDYKESVMSEIAPEWTRNGSMRTHTLSLSERFLVTDTFKYVSRIS